MKVKSEVSKKNKYHVEKFRYLELKNFCFQYPTWKKMYASLDGLSKRPDDLEKFRKDGVEDPTSGIAVTLEKISRKMELIEQAAIAANPEISQYLIVGVTEKIGYDILTMRYPVPCSRETYYVAYRKFFWILNKTRE